MNIAVLIKQVPETDNLVIDEETGTVKREGVESIVNPLDLYALESSLKVKETMPDTTITVLSMGPESAGRALREAIAMGADEAVLLTDRSFAGSDTYATSLILSTALKKIKKFDLVLCGEKAVDGDTGQVGSEIAAFMDMDIVSFVSRIWFADGDLYLERITENGTEVVRAELPVAAAVTKAVGEPRLPTLQGKKKARKADVVKYNLKSLGLDASRTGLKGSPTKVVKIMRPSIRRDPVILTPKTEYEIIDTAERLAEFLNEKRLIGQKNHG